MDRILAILQARPEGLTPMDALTEVGCFRLAAAVWTLRAEGWDITTTLEESGTGNRYARYRLIPPRSAPRHLAGQLELHL